MEHEAIFKLASECVNTLRIALGAERGDDQGLRFAACEQGRAVGAWEHRIANFDGAHGARVAAINAGLACQNLTANGARFNVEQHVVNFDAIELDALLFQASFSRGIHLAASLRAGLLVADLVSGFDFFFSQRHDFSGQAFVFGFCCPGAALGPQRFARFFNEIMNRVNCNA